jgi:hypothetical protein
MRGVLKIVIAVTVLLSLTMITAAQNQPLAFEVASIKPTFRGQRIKVWFGNDRYGLVVNQSSVTTVRNG